MARLHYQVTRNVLLVATLIFIPYSAQSQNAGELAETVCTGEAIAGLQSYTLRGKRFLSHHLTDDPENMEIYISVVDQLGIPASIYVQSNYIWEGREYPTKLATTRTEVNLPFLLYNITRMPAIDVSKIKFFVEGNVFNSANYSDLDFGNNKNVRVIGPDDVPRLSTSIRLSGGRSARIVFLSPYISISAKEVGSITALNLIADEKFERGKVRLLNLVLHNKTKNKIADLIPVENQIEIDLQSINKVDPSSALKVMNTTMAVNPNTVLFILGHVDEPSGDFVVKNAGNEEVFRLSISEAQRLAEKYNITLMALGCNTAQYGKRGTVQKIDSIHVVERLSLAMQKAKTLGEFLRYLSSSRLGFVIDSGIIDGVHVRLEIAVLNNSALSIRDAYRSKEDKESKYAGDSGDNGGSGRYDKTGSNQTTQAQADGVLKIYHTRGIHPLPPPDTPTPTPTPDSTPADDKQGKFDSSLVWVLVTIVSVSAIALLFKKMRPPVQLKLNRDEESVIIFCLNCDTKNKVIKSRIHKARCGRCHEPMR